MASPKKKPKPTAKKNPKRETDAQVLRKLFPSQVVDYVETQLKEADESEDK
jgi:hypothetical protein